MKELDLDELAKFCRGGFDESGGMYFPRKAWGNFCSVLQGQDFAPALDTLIPSGMEGDKRIDYFMAVCGHPNSLSLYRAFKEFEKELKAKPDINWEPLQEFWRANSSADWDQLETAVLAATGNGDKA